MGVTNSNKQLSMDRIGCDGTLKVTIALTAAPDITANPVDIVLVLDRSGSMAGSPLANMKAGAKTFIDIISQATGGEQSGQIGGGSRIGVVSFASSATANTQLITSVAALKSAVDTLSAGGSTNHADAFTKAGELFNPASSNQKVVVMFTDGKTTAGDPPAPVAASLRAEGVVIYCIGLVGTDGIDVDTLNNWATDPDDSHVAVTPDEGELEDLFADLAANISKPGATNIVIDEVVSTDFVITGTPVPSKGAVNQIGDRKIQWTIASLGATASEGASLEFYVRHVAQTPGVKHVNESITYTDKENNYVVFPDPMVTVDCDDEPVTEPCPEPVDIIMEGCKDSVSVDLGETELESQGRILQVSATVKNVCPNKRVALAIVLTEVDKQGKEHPRGLKAFTIPAHHSPICRDVEVKCVKFVLPEDLNISGGTPGMLCSPRKLKARLISHYIDSDFQCCDAADAGTP